ncbi:NAD-dependent epimerase/dehydratase family protein [Streptomyces sp. URMC 123]|uniref:NAD-dependent epimerase/dehydratase family protein n=1 Tax=Streptomyces sp. URMC 123 TaxID=3423403 RepID=UPI003F1D1900
MKLTTEGPRRPPGPLSFVRSRDPRGPLITVLGASGFLGSAVVAELAALPVRLRLVARGPSHVPAAPVADIEVRRADLARRDAVAAAVEDADAVVHLAAAIGGQQSWRAADERAARVNVGMMRDLVDVLRGRGGAPPAVVFAGTLQAGPPAAGAAPLVDTGTATGTAPLGGYAAQKLAAEAILREATAEGAVHGVVLRLSTLYGHSPLSGGAGRGVLAAMARRALADEPLTMWHDGSVERDFLHVRDAATAFVAALEHAADLAGEPWIVGTGRLARLGDVFTDLAGLVAEHTGRPAVPVLAVPPPAYAEAGDFHSPESDPSAFRAASGWAPRVPFADGLRAMVAAIATPGPGTAAGPSAPPAAHPAASS